MLPYFAYPQSCKELNKKSYSKSKNGKKMPKKLKNFSFKGAGI